VSKRHAITQSDAGTLAAYLREIGKLPLLTLDEERALGARIQQERDEAAEANPVPSSSASIAATLHGPRYDPRMGGPKTEHSPGAFASGVSA